MLGATCPQIPRAPLHSTFESTEKTTELCTLFFTALTEVRACQGKTVTPAGLQNDISSCVESIRRSINRDRAGIALGVAGVGLVAWLVFRKR